MSNIVLNIVEPGSSTPPVPDTGLWTNNSSIGNGETAIIATISIVVILAIVAVIATIYYHRKKQGKTPSFFAHFKHNKSTTTTTTTTGLAILALLVSIGTVAGLLKLGANAEEADNAETQNSTSSLTVSTSDTNLTIELADEPVFAVLPVDITVAEATEAGYTLTAYTGSTNLVSTTDSSNIIPMVTVDTTDIEEADEAEELRSLESDAVESSDSSSLVSLSPNTYGLSLVDPESNEEEVYTSLSTDSANPTFITNKDYEATEEDDVTTIYYGFYITPDIPYGTYTGSNISVDAISNIATVTFDANGLYFNNSEEDTENILAYKPNINESPIEEITGEYLTPAPLTPSDQSSPSTIHYTFLGWSEDKDATEATYTNEEDILANLTLTKNESLTLYAVWHYNTVLSFNGNTSDGGEAMEEQTIAAGTTITLPQNTFTRTGSVFTNWNTVETPTVENPGTEYEDEATFTAPNESADITLYAQWAYTTTITFSGNGANSGTMNPQTIVAGTPQSLTPNAYTKTNATFIGWNTVQNPTPQNPGTSYSDQAEFTASTEEHQDITLYAQWAYTTIFFNGNTSDSGSMNSITIAGGTTSNLPQNTFTENNCIFTGWNTEASGTGTSYGNSSPYTANATAKEEFTLYAQWQCVSQVNYYGNGATSGQMASNIILGGSTLTFPQNSYVKDGYIFNGWNTQADGTGTPYEDQGTFTASMTPATTLNLYAQWMPTTTITFNGNDATSGTMSDQVIVAGSPQNLTPNAFAKDGYIFNGWNTVQTPTTENPGTVYADKAEYTASTTQPENITLYAQWVLPLTFTAGDHIDTLMVADSSQNWKPFYVTTTSTDRSIVFSAPAEGTKYIVTVVPEAGYVLSSDSTNSSYEVAFSTGTLASNTLLTTTYTAGSAGNNITISAAQAGSDTAHPAYTTMQSLTAAQCPAYTNSAQGINVTDSRDNKSYTVAKFGNYCYMLSNLRLDGGTELDVSSSHVSSAYTLPADTGSGGWTDDSCQPRMASTNGEYYYNWPAATARTNSTSGSSSSSCSNDTSNSKGDICPAGWSLPTYQDIAPATLWNNGANPGMLSTAGSFNSVSHGNVGGRGIWWSSTRYNNYYAYHLNFYGSYSGRDRSAKDYGYSVRCVRSS